MKQISTYSTLPLLFAIVVLAGCGGPDNVGRVEGTITLDGDPLPGAMIEFVPDARDGRTSYGTADEHGRYTMIYYGDTPGAELGVNTVKITFPDPGDSLGEPVVIPAKYNTKSQEKREVLPGENTFDFEIETE